MAQLSAAESAVIVLAAVTVNREDVARAKQWVLARDDSIVRDMADAWLDELQMSTPKSLNAESDTYEESLKRAGESFGLRLALYQALWELISSGDLFMAGSPMAWEATAIEYKTGRGAEGMPLKTLTSSYPDKIQRSKLTPIVSADVDIFLKGIDMKTLNSGIHEAIDRLWGAFEEASTFLPP